jgi:hypothetical protein
LLDVDESGAYALCIRCQKSNKTCERSEGWCDTVDSAYLHLYHWNSQHMLESNVVECAPGKSTCQKKSQLGSIRVGRLTHTRAEKLQESFQRRR